jgi:hypothetical protein
MEALWKRNTQRSGPQRPRSEPRTPIVPGISGSDPGPPALAPTFHAGDHRFESGWGYWIYAVRVAREYRSWVPDRGETPRGVESRQGKVSTIRHAHRPDAGHLPPRVRREHRGVNLERSCLGSESLPRLAEPCWAEGRCWACGLRPECGVLSPVVQSAAPGEVALSRPKRNLCAGGSRGQSDHQRVALDAPILGQAILLWRPDLLWYTGFVALALVAWVYGLEQPELQGRFGARYDEYRRAVPGWWRRRRPWQPR